MNYEKAVKRKRSCITSLLILIMWGWGGVNSHIEKIKANPELGLLIFGGLFGIPIVVLLIMTVFYSIKAKQAEFDDLDEDEDFENNPAQEDETQNDNNSETSEDK